MKRFCLKIIVALAVALLLFPSTSEARGRKQWTEKQAWAWQKKVGALKGFNQPREAYPGMTRRDMFRKAHELGFNTVRLWIGGNGADEQVERLKQCATEAAEFNLTLAPVMSLPSFFDFGSHSVKDTLGAKKYVKTLVRAFANDKRFVMWDVWNEPDLNDKANLRSIAWLIQQAALWAYEENPMQAITSSLLWDNFPEDKPADVRELRDKTEGMMDVHNFHSYSCGDADGELAMNQIRLLRKISDRPIVCTECVDRVDGSGYSRSLPLFSREHVNFYAWGLYQNDHNWTVKWNRSAYNPYGVTFHDLLHPDGNPIDWRDLQLIRDFHFAAKGENVDASAEVTERWTKSRAWFWMNTEPVRGVVSSAPSTDTTAAAAPYNGVRIYLDYNEWKQNGDGFMKKFEQTLAANAAKGVRVLPVLLSDKDAGQRPKDLAEYAYAVIAKHAADDRIVAWDLYEFPGKSENDTQKLTALLHYIFHSIRLLSPNQPLTATPWVTVKTFAKDFDYLGALVHGHNGGWDMLECNGGSTPTLCNLVWQLSDVISFAGNASTEETGWLTTIAFRYGRPLFCTLWSPQSEEVAEKTLERFQMSHVNWFGDGHITNTDKVRDFSFKPIMTPR